MYKTLHLFNFIYHHLPLSTLISVHLPYSPLIYRHSPSTIFISLFLSSFTFIFYHPWKTFQESAVFDSYPLKRQKSPFWPSKFQQFLRSMLSIYPSKDFIYSANINPTPLTNPRSALSSELTSYNKISILQVLLYFFWHYLWLIKFYHQRRHSQ